MKGKFCGILLSALLLVQSTYANAEYDENIGCDVPCCGWGTFEIGGEWLYWRADQDSMNYAIHNTSVTENGGTILDEFRSPVGPKFAGKSGYRLFASYETADTNWKVGAIFTHAPSNASSSVLSPTPVLASDFIQVLAVNFALLNDLTLANFSETSAQWDVKVNYFDLDLQRNISLCQYFDIAPHVGFRALWIEQSFHWNGVRSTGETHHGLAKLKVDGYGVEGGLLGKWNVGYGFSLIGNIGGSLLYSRVKSNGVLHSELFPLTTNDHYADTFHRSIPTFDTFIGVQYNTCLWDYNIGIRAGWENHIFFSVNQFSLNKTENLSMQGLTLGGAFGF